MSPTGWILLAIVGFVTALNPAPHRTNEESLRGALNAVSRKQRSLDYNTREIYNNLPSSLKYRTDNDRKFDRQRDDNDFDEDEEELEFLPLENGQIEPIGDGYSINEKLLERALEDYAKSEQAQEEPRSSLFRERERNAGIKRGMRSDRSNSDDELARLFLEELEYGSPYSQDEMEDGDYNTLRMLHRPEQENRYYGNDALVSWGDILDKKPLRQRMRDDGEVEFPDREQALYLMPLERRNVNARYPLGRDYRNFRELSKRFPVAKRSAKAVSQSNQITDPKVAQDLGSLFGTQPNGNKNHTHDHEGHNHDHNHAHNSDKSPINQHGSEVHGMSNQEVTSTTPSVSPHPNGQKENVTKAIKPKERSIEVKKKSVNWSDYFGIDRRKKKSTFMPKPGSQNQDDEWFLERYYKTMAENLKYENDKDGDENANKDKLQQMDSRLRNIKDLIIQEALNADGMDIQEIKDKVMSRLAAAYSLEKMRKALKEFRDNVISQRENQKLAQIQDTLTTNRPEDNVPADKTDEKRSHIGENEEGFDEGNTCPELDLIERHCKTGGYMSHDIRNVLHDACVSTLICRSCGGQDCLGKFAMEVEKTCEILGMQQTIWSREQCIAGARLLPINPPSTLVALCHSEGRESCLIRHYYHNRQRNLYPHEANHRFGYEILVPQQR